MNYKVLQGEEDSKDLVYLRNKQFVFYRYNLRLTF